MSDYVIPCSECQAGQMRRAYLVYYTWLGNELITVPDFPSWVCDVCGRREYDIHALNRLSLILSPNAGNSTSRKRSRQTTHGLRVKRSRPSQPE